MATILSGKKSSYGSPTAYYTVSVTTKSRTASSVVFVARVSGHLASSSSSLGSGLSLVAGIYAGGSWHTKTLKSSSSSWSGTGTHTISWEFTVSGLSATQTSVTGIKFRCLRGDSYGNERNSTQQVAVAFQYQSTPQQQHQS